MGAVLGSTLVEVEELVVTEVSDDSSPGFGELVFPFVPGFPPQAVRARAMAPNATAGAMNLHLGVLCLSIATARLAKTGKATLSI